MGNSVIAALVGGLLRLLSPETMKLGIDKFLDVIEDKIAQSPNQIDDAVVLPLIKNIRAAINVPDND